VIRTTVGGRKKFPGIFQRILKIAGVFKEYSSTSALIP